MMDSSLGDCLWAAVLPAFLRGLLANRRSSSGDLTDRRARQAGEIHRAILLDATHLDAAEK
jgi:hypothetical protein